MMVIFPQKKGIGQLSCWSKKNANVYTEKQLYFMWMIPKFNYSNPTGMCSMFPRAVIKDDQNPRTPLGLWLGDIAIDTLNRISDMFRSLQRKVQYNPHTEKKNLICCLPNFQYRIH
jgi:hypothetical protein